MPTKEKQQSLPGGLMLSKSLAMFTVELGNQGNPGQEMPTYRTSISFNCGATSGALPITLSQAAL